MENWKSLFQPHILQRGRNYYKEGWVGSISEIENGYAAIVEGTEDYEVEIYVQKRGSSQEVIHDMYCSCPYAQDGNYCKHMAAVLYEIEENERIPQNTITASYLSENELVRKTLADMSEEQVRGELLSLAMGDKSIAQRIITRYSNTFDAKQLSRLKDKIHQIAWENSDRSGFVDYWHADDYVSEMLEFMYEHVENLIGRRALMPAFELVGEVFVTVATQEMDDSDGGVTILAGKCQQYWQQIIDAAGDEEQKQIYQWFEKKANDPAIFDYMDEVLREVQMTAFHSEELLKLRLRQLDAMIAKLEKEETENSYYVEYQLENAVENRLQTMIELQMPDADVEAYRRKYWSLASIRRLAVMEERSRKNSEKAIEYLKQSKEIDRGNLRRVAEWSEQLAELYYECGRQEEYKKEFIFLVMKTNAFSMDNIKKLKQICGVEEWLLYREELLTNEKYASIRYDLMAEEKLYDRLLAEMQQATTIYTLDRYEKVLKTHDPVQLRDLYVYCIKQAMGRATNRKNYYSVVQYLKKIKHYPDGPVITKAMANDWRAIYPRRSAMMDELRKAGF